ncbi:Uncharacterised protein [Shigella sonnei]|nr:Uncharacterised protein [Shigella sonnei]
MIRATAIVRIKSKASTSSLSASGVPFTFTSMLIGTLSGGVGRFASCSNNPARSFTVSPKPTMPPEQTLIPASRTFSSVSRRS